MDDSLSAPHLRVHAFAHLFNSIISRLATGFG